jgi:hypothetical protein
LESAKEVFSRHLGLFDRATIKAYFGTQPHRSLRKLQKIARYATGTISFKNIELTQDIPQKRGYLEILGLATIEKKGQTWFLKINEVSVVAEMRPQHYEGSEKPIEEISLSSITPPLRGETEGAREPALEKNSGEGSLTKEIKTNNNIQGEREKSDSNCRRAPSQQIGEE